jgi:hypothetical protein
MRLFKRRRIEWDRGKQSRRYPDRGKKLGSLHIDTAMNDSFPASDPPASRIPDEPPVNAAANWEAAYEQ